MQPIDFPGAVEIKKPEDMTDDKCYSTYAMLGIDNFGERYWLQAWKPSYEDLQALNRGEPIYIKLTRLKQLVPMAVFTLDENDQHNDAG